MISEAARKLPALTTLSRDEWADIRHEHLCSGKNKSFLDALEKSIFIVVLSEESPSSLSEKGKFLLHADGKTLWYDKSVNFVFFKNGQCGLNVEHSMADGKKLIRIVSDQRLRASLNPLA